MHSKKTNVIKKTNKHGEREPDDEKVPSARLEGRIYGNVTKMVGDRRFLAICSDGKERLCHIPKKFKGKKFWISTDMIVLLNRRTFEDAKADVIYIYNEKELRYLRKQGEFEVFEKKISGAEDGFVFEDDDEEKSVDIDNL